MLTRLSPFVLAAALVVAMPAISPAQDVGDEVVRHPIPESDFPIAMAVEVPADATLVYVSGTVPPVVDENAPSDSTEAYGDTRQQTEGVLRQIQERLRDIGLKMDDVVKMQVFLVGDPANDGRMDFEGLMGAYTQYFGTEQQPNLPARSVVQVAGLANPGWLVEIEVVAVRQK